jgi:hypothetical protein
LEGRVHGNWPDKLIFALEKFFLGE